MHAVLREIFIHFQVKKAKKKRRDQGISWHYRHVENDMNKYDVELFITTFIIVFNRTINFRQCDQV